MSRKPDFDVTTAHRYFSAECFNSAWDLMDKPGRNAEENEQMLRLSLASHWHWTQRPDVTSTNVSIGYWQTSRIYSMLGQADNARHYAMLCFEASKKEDVLPFYLGYAYEALARAESVAGNWVKMDEYLVQAHAVAAKVTNSDEAKQLQADLGTIK
jgi:hypothetical protein